MRLADRREIRGWVLTGTEYGQYQFDPYQALRDKFSPAELPQLHAALQEVESLRPIPLPNEWQATVAPDFEYLPYAYACFRADTETKAKVDLRKRQYLSRCRKGWTLRIGR